MRNKVLIGYDKSIPGILEAFSPRFHLMPFSAINELPLDSIEGLICRSVSKINQSTLNKQKKIKWVATATSGLCHIDTKYLQKNNISLFDAKGGNSQSVAEYVLSTLAYALLEKKLKLKTIGIVGVGYVGQKVKQILEPLGFKLLLSDPFRKDENHFNHQPLEALSQCDAITLHTPYTKNGPYPTHHLIDEKFLSTLKKNTLIINTARGQCLDENALLANNSLQYCLDVYQDEPNINPKIIDKALICTPHIAGHAINAKLRMTKIIQQKIYNFYQLPLSTTSEKKQDAPPPLNDFLKAYSPLTETLLLKKSPTEHTFKKVRKAHHRFELCA